LAEQHLQHNGRTGAEFVGGDVIGRERTHLGADVDADDGAAAPVDQLLGYAADVATEIENKRLGVGLLVLSMSEQTAGLLLLAGLPAHIGFVWHFLCFHPIIDCGWRQFYR
jgi:hypothetical protein